MKKYFYLAFTFLAMFLFGTACTGPVKKHLPKEKVSESNLISVGHPKLIKTIGDPRYGNVQCGLQDKPVTFGSLGGYERNRSLPSPWKNIY